MKTKHKEMLKELVAEYGTLVAYDEADASRFRAPVNKMARNAPEATHIFAHTRAKGDDKSQMAHLGRIADNGKAYTQHDGIEVVTFNSSPRVAVLDKASFNDSWDGFNDLTFDEQVEMLNADKSVEFVCKAINMTEGRPHKVRKWIRN